jgi:hypothetical protein
MHAIQLDAKGLRIETIDGLEDRPFFLNLRRPTLGSL